MSISKPGGNKYKFISDQQRGDNEYMCVFEDQINCKNI